MMLSIFALAGTLSLSEPAQAQPVPPQNEIVVTGRKRDLKAALERCLARNCPTPEDVDATLGYAEELFVTGDYDEAHQAIKDSLRRNHDKARQYPEPVSDLYRSDAKVARHLGLDDEAMRSTRQIYNALKQGIPAPDVRHFTARIEMASSYLAFGRYSEARGELAQLEREAHAAGRDDIAQMAELKALWVDYVESPSAISEISKAAQNPDPRKSILAIGAKALLTQIHGEEGKLDRDSFLASVKTPSTHRVLLFDPPYELATHDTLPGPELNGSLGPSTLTQGNVLNRLSDTFRDSWIDVDFWIAPDGRVTDLQILRQGSNAGWAAPLLASIRGRRYSVSSDGKPTHRIERYTYTAGYEMRAGSHLMQRSPRARVEYLDLTPAPGTAGAG
jgi:hypothetical protein